MELIRREPRSSMAGGTRSCCPVLVLFLLLLVGVAARVASGVVTDGLLPNGDFELGPAKSDLNSTRVMHQNSIPSWEISGFVEYIESGQQQGDMILPVPEGARAVRLGNDATIRQKLSVDRKTTYSITFCAARTCAQAERLNVSAAAESGVLPIQTVYTSTGWDSYSYAFRARHSAVWLSIHNPGHEDDPACGPLIDSVAIKALHNPPPRLITKGNNVLSNGDFEEGPFIFPGTAWGVLVPPANEDDVSPLPGWTVLSGTKKAVKCVDAAHHAVPRGDRAVELVAGREAALAQDARTLPGRRYRLSFSVGDAGDGCEGAMAVEAYAGPAATARAAYASRGKGGSTRAAVEFAAAANVTRVVFQSYNVHVKPDGTLCGPVVDDVSLVALRKYAARRLLL